MRFSVLIEIYCGFAVLGNFLCGFSVCNRPQCPPPLRLQRTELLNIYIYIYMLFAGWEVRIVKNCDRGHSFSLYGPTVSR